MTTKTAPPKKHVNFGTAKKRTCPICFEFTTVYIRQDGQWEVWTCSSCGCRKDYRTLGRAN